MRPCLALILAVLIWAPPRAASATQLQPDLAGLGFLLGSWSSGQGKVAETGGTSEGTSRFTAEAGGAVLLRQDHVELFGKTGKPTGAFDILMTIYAEQGAIHADYFDGTHIIHYDSASLVPGKSVMFTTGTNPQAPAFHLSYKLAGNTLAVSFAMSVPGQTSFVPIATGTLRRAPS